MRHHVGLNLAHEVHRHNDHNQQRRTAEVERNVKTQIQELRDKAHERQIRGTAERQTCQHLIDIPGCLLTGTNSGNKSAAFLQILSRLFRVENQRRVEEGKENNQSRIQQRVQGLSGAQCRRQIANPTGRIAAREPAG